MPPNVSAIITTFNRCAIVVDAIASVLAQTHPVGELIVVDDGSTDHTEESVKTVFKTANVPCRYIKKPNGGMASSLNRGVDEAQSDLVAFLDDDDLWHTNHIERSLQLLTTYSFLGCIGGLRDFSSGLDATNGTTEKPAHICWHPIRQALPIRRC